MPALLPNRGHAALLRSAVLALAATVAFPTVAQACSTLTPEGEARRDRQQVRWLYRETDLKVRGTFVEIPQPADDEQDDYVYRRGIITAADGRRYRVTVPGVINCGFPNYYVYDGSEGLFYLKRSKYPDDKDSADGVIDNYDYIHFRSGRGK
jgi:hypothetical protein